MWTKFKDIEIQYLYKCGNSIAGLAILQNSSSERSHTKTNTPGGVALELNNILGTANHFFVQLGPIFYILFCSNTRINVTEPYTS